MCDYSLHVYPNRLAADGIGECVDLSWGCLRNVGPELWAIHVPLGKLKTERMVPLDSFVRELVQRLRFFRSFDPLPPDGHLLARPNGKNALIRQLRYYLHEVCCGRHPHPHRAAPA